MTQMPMSAEARHKLETRNLEAKQRASITKQDEKNHVRSVAKKPAWSSTHRNLPNVMIRSSLFAAIDNGKHPDLEHAEINTREDTSIIYSGAQLNQVDLSVWATVSNLANEKKFDTPLKTSNYQILEVMGVRGGGASEKTLKDSLARLCSGKLEINTSEGLQYKGQLIDRVEYNKSGRGMIIFLNPGLAPLFSADKFTRTDWKIFKALQKKPLSQWLHLFYSSHVKAYALKTETIRQYCGSKCNYTYKFSQQLRKALKTLHEVYALNEKSFTYTIEDGLVRVTKTASDSQARRNKNNVRASRPIP